MKIKRILSILLSLMLLSGMLPAVTLPAQAAAATTYSLWLGGVHVTDVNKDDITAAINAASPDAASGKAVYDPANNVLTLTDFVYSGAGYNDAALYCEPDDDLTIAFNGECSLTQTGGEISYGIYIGNSITVYFRGGEDSKLAVTGKTGSVNGYSYSFGIMSYAPLVFSGGTVHATGGQSLSFSYGIYCYGITVDRMTLTAEG